VPVFILSVEKMFETVNDAGNARHFFDREIDSRHVTGAVVRVVTDFQRLPVTAENDFLLRKNAGQPDAMYAKSLIVTAAGSLDRLLLVRIALSQFLPVFRDHFGGFDGGAGRRI